MSTIKFGRDSATGTGTFYSSFHRAANIAAALRLYETEGWTYVVIAAGNYFKVSIADEDGEFVAFWQGLPS